MADELTVPETTPVKTPDIVNPGEMPSSGNPNMDAIARLKRATLLHEPVFNSQLSDRLGQLQPGTPPIESLRNWSSQSKWHASSLLGDDEIHITDAQLKMALENTKKYKPLDDVTTGEAFEQGFDQAELYRLAFRKEELSDEETVKFNELIEKQKIYANRIGSDSFVNKFTSVVGNLGSTVRDRVIPGAAIGGAVGSVVPGLGTGAGAATGAVTGFTADSYIQTTGATRLALDDIPELNDHPNLKLGVASSVGAITAALDKFGFTEAVFGKFATNGLRSTKGLQALSRGILGDPATMGKLETFTRSAAFGGLAEGSTESLQEVVSILGEYAATKLSGERLDPDSERQLLTIENFKNVFEAGLLGATVGGALAVPRAILEAEDAGKQSTILANKILDAHTSVSQTALAKNAPEVARDMLHAVDLHQTVYLEPDVLDSVDVKILKDMGIKAVDIASARDLGQQLKISTTNLLTAKSREDLESILPFVKQSPNSDLPDVSQMDFEYQTGEALSPNTAKLSLKLIEERKNKAREVQEYLIESNNKATQDKIAFDYAKKTKIDQIVKVVNESPSLSHELAARFGGDPRQYAKTVVEVWANQAEFVADSEMTKIDWMNALKIESITRLGSKANSMGVYGNKTITLNKASNGTTLIHEGSHHFLQMWIEAHAADALTGGRKADLESLAKWAGTSLDEVKSSEDAYRKFHEAVAVATEETLQTGTFLQNMSNSVRKMFDRIVAMFQKYYNSEKIKAQEGRVEITPEVQAIMDRWMFGGEQADVTAAHANLLPEQVDAEFKKLGLNEQQSKLAKTSLGRALESARTRMIRENARLFREKRRQYVAEATSNANQTPGRVAITVGQNNKLSAFEVRTSYGEDTLRELRKRDMISAGTDEVTIQELVAESGFDFNEFFSQLLTPGGEYAVDMMETIRFVKESGNLREDWVRANYSQKDARIILSIAKTIPEKSVATSTKPYQVNTKLYSRDDTSVDSINYSRSIIAEQFKNRFTDLHKKMVEIIEQKQLNTIVSNTEANVGNYNKIRNLIDRKLQSVRSISIQAENRADLFDIGSRKKVFSSKDVSFLRKLAEYSELADVKEDLLQETLAIENALFGIGSSIVARSDIKATLDRFLETDKHMREVYKIGDWWDQQWFSRWLTGDADTKTKAGVENEIVGTIARMPDAWTSYFNLLDSIKAGDTEGLRHAWLREQVPPQVRSQLQEITAPPDATGSTEFGTVRPVGDFNTLSGPEQKVETAFTSEERNAETRRLLLAMAMVPRNIRETMYVIHGLGGISEKAAEGIPANAYALLSNLNLIKEDGILAAGKARATNGSLSLAQFYKDTKKALGDMDSLYEVPVDVDSLILEVLDTPAKIQDQIQAEVKAKMNDLLVSPSPEMLLNDQKYWNHMKDMSIALAHIFNNETTGISKIAPATYIDQARNELANMPVKEATDTKKAFGDFARSQKIVKRAIFAGKFRQALIAHNTGMRNYQRVIQGGEFKASVDRAVKAAKTMAKIKPGELDAKYHGAYLVMAHKIGLIPRVPKWAKDYAPGEILEKYSLGEANRIIQLVKAESTDYKLMSSGNFVTLNEALQMLKRLATLNSGANVIELTSVKETTSAKELSDKGLAELNGYTPPTGVLGRVVSKLFSAADVIATPLEYLFEVLNKQQNVLGTGKGGVFKTLYNEFLVGSRTQEKELEKMLDIHTELSKFHKIASTMPKVNKNLKVDSTKPGFQWTPEAVFNFCAIYGNKYQAQALRDGYNLTEAEAQQVLDALPEEAWPIVDNLIKILGANKEKLFTTHEKVEGYKPTSEDASPFLANGKVRNGGWVPLYYDSEYNLKGVTTLDDMSLESTFALFPPSASTGREKARRGSGGRPPLLSTEIFGRGMRDQIHYISYAQPISTFNAVMAANKGALNAEVKRVLGDEYYKLLMNNIKSLDPKQANQFKAQGTINRFITYYLRPMSSLSALAGNIESAIRSHISQYAISTNVVGLENFTAGLADAALNPEMRKFARDNSPHLKETLGAIESQAIRMSTEFSNYSNYRKGIRAVRPILMMQHMLADYPQRYATWIGAYKKNAHLPEDQRILEADKLVSKAMPVGATLEKIEASWNENGFTNIISAFLISASAANSRLKAHYNAWLSKEIDDITFAKFVVTERLMSPLLWSTAIPIVGYALTRDDDYLDGLDKKKLAVELAGYQLSGLPIVRELSGYASQVALDKPASIRPTPLGFTEAVLNQGKVAALGFKDDPQQSAINAALLFGASQGIPLNVFYDRMQRNMEKNGGDLAEAFVTGKP